MARLIVESGPHRGKVVEIPEHGGVDAGRDSGRFVHIPDQKVSRQHFRVHIEGKEIVIEDAGSSNGTFVNGKRIQKATIKNGDLIRAGDTFISLAMEPVEPLLGKVIGGYRIETRLGRGGMGTVYRAVQASLDRPVAIKVLSRSLAEDGDFVHKFLTEARMAAKIDHPNVVRVYDVGQDEGQFFFSMELMPGGSLQALIEREGGLPAGRAVEFILGAANALVWAGENHIVHRDIKPDNLLIGEAGEVKVADFGVAADERTSKTLYAGGKILGTPSFMPPEQALGKKVDHRADLYALGSTLYAAIAGVPPFVGETAVEILVKKTKEDPRPLREVAPKTPAAVTAVVEKLMAREPEDRYPTAKEARDALLAALEASKGGEERGWARAFKERLRKLAHRDEERKSG